MQDSQSDVRAKRFAGMREELEGLRVKFDDLKRRATTVVKDAAARRDAWLLEHTRNEHLG